jgi:6-phosphogluconolactonase
MPFPYRSFLGAAWLTFALPSGAVAAEQYLVYVGTYTGEHSQGIHAFRLDADTGLVESLGLAAETPNPTFLALHPNGKYLYAANEIGKFRGQPGGAVTAFAIDTATGRLRELSQGSTRGGGPCHLVVDRTGRQVLVANYGGGSVASLPVGSDGRVGEPSAFFQHTGGSVNPSRQKEPHAHSINLAPDSRYAFAADLGTDRIYRYGFDPARGLTGPAAADSVQQPPGSGPRHFAFHPSGKFAYAINELLSTVSAFRYDPAGGQLKPVGLVSTLPAGFTGNNSTAEVVVHPGGKFVYGSNRGHNSLAIFRADPASGALTPVGHHPSGGKTPRNFNFDPTGRWAWIANQDSHTVTIHRVDLTTGLMTPTGQELKVGMPVCVKFLRVP